MEKICKYCGKEFDTNSSTKRKVFCNSSCAAKFNNKDKVVSEETRLKISKALKGRKQVYKKDQSITVGNAVKTGKKVKSIFELSSRTISKLLQRLNIGCCICDWKESSCDIHHINGRKIEDPHNHKNLTILCPNHHRMIHNKRLDKSLLKTIDEILPYNWQDYYYG